MAKFDAELERKYRALIDEYAKALAWTRDKLKESQAECRNLKVIIMKITESKEEEPDAVFDP